MSGNEKITSSPSATPIKKERLDGSIGEKLRGNAISAYLMIFFSALFLLNKSNKYINNDFVIGHTKNAIFIHLGFLITYIIFISNSFLSYINIIGFGLNYIITDIIYGLLLIILIIGIYRSYRGEKYSVFSTNNLLLVTNKKKILDITGDGELSEKEKLTILLSFVPLIGFINFAKYKENTIIQNGTRLNIVFSLIITLLYIFSYGNLANIFSLFYIVLIVFIGINLFARDQLIQLKLPNIFSPQNAYILIISSKTYFKNYFNDNEFKKLYNLIKDNTDRINKHNLFFEERLKDKKELKLPKFLVYIPVINLIFLFYKESRLKFHIINGITISILVIISLFFSYFGYLVTNYYLLFLFPILFGIGYINNNILAYRMPIIFDLYVVYKKIVNFLRSNTNRLNEKRNEVKEVNLKV